MKQIRLLPVVIVAACALFLLKGVGIMTNGGYVLMGPTAAEAAGEGADPGSDSGGATLTLPAEPTMTDTSPVLEDTAPTLPLGPAADAHDGEAEHGEDAATAGEAAEGSQGEADEGQSDQAAADEPVAPADGALVAEVAAGEACPPVEATAAEGQDAPAEDAAGAPAGDGLEGFDFIKPVTDCAADPEVNEHGDALPTIQDGAGNIMPLEATDGTATENALLERLAERRDDLDAREAELAMRMALVEAAEKRIEERTASLEALEARINAMVDEKRTLEESQFVGVVAMYETMKPKDAAAIFDQLELPVLLRVARAINPRKMAPIMAKMDPMIAKELTAGLAVDRVEPTIDLGKEDLASLPQIVGQ